jgi:hypothetical protein
MEWKRIKRWRRRRPRSRKQYVPVREDTWLAPHTFGIFNDGERATLLKKLSDLRYRIAVKREPVCLDFSRTEKMIADGTLLFVAELRRLIKHVEGRVQITYVAPLNDKVAQVMQQIGLCDLLGVKTDIEPKDDDVVNWRYAHGSQVEGQKYEDVLSKYDGEIARAMQEKLFTGITEAMTNVLNHAYDLEREDGLNVMPSKEWWMFSQEKDGFLSVAFCDLGAGIPRTLPIKQPRLWRRITKLGKSTDADAIDHAIRDSTSRTHESHRGHGLGQIVRVVEAIQSAEVAIYSNRGTYIRHHGEKKLYRHSDSILGTLIFWKVPLRSQEVAR